MLKGKILFLAETKFNSFLLTIDFMSPGALIRKKAAAKDGWRNLNFPPVS